MPDGNDIKAGKRTILNNLNFSHGILLVEHVDILLQCVKVVRYILGVVISLSDTLPSSDTVCGLL
jgi:hypothetical protein